MKWFSFVVFLLLGTLWVQAATEEDLQDLTKTTDKDDEDFYNSIKELFEKRCQAIGGDTAAKNIATAITNVKVCLGDNLPKNKDELKDINDSDSSEALCAEKRTKIRDCFKDFVQVWEDCSKPEEKYFAGFIFDALDGLYDYICANDGAAVFKLLSEDSLECLSTLMEKENVTDVCDDKLKIMKDDSSDEDVIFPKADLCQDLSTVKTCYGDYIKHECPKDTNFREVFAGLIDAISSPCKKHRRDLLGLPLPYSKQ